jgi:branched-chain amino acid transport system permease protein
MNAYLVSLFTIVAVNTILALSLNIITGFCGQVSLGHAAFYGIGAYAGALLALHGAPFPLALAGAFLITGLFGVVVGLASLRVRHDFLAVVTMGVGFLFLGFVRKQRWLGGELGLTGIPESGLSALGNLIFISLAAILILGFCLYLRRSWMGVAFDAVARDQDAAATLGIDVARFKLAAFGIGTSIAGFAGAFYAYFARSILPDTFGFLVSVMILATIVIGGLRSVAGVAVAAVLLTLMPEWFRFVNEYRLLVFGGLLVAVMLFSPGGLAGLLTRIVAWRGAGRHV